MSDNEEPDWSAIRQADKEGRVDWPTCPECGEQVRGMGQDLESEDVPEVARMWPGGPLVSVPGSVARRRVVNVTYTAQPCGHVVPHDYEWTITVRPGNAGAGS